MTNRMETWLEDEFDLQHKISDISWFDSIHEDP